MKKVYLDLAGKMHSLYNELILYPPEGYEFITGQTIWHRASSLATGLDFLYRFQETVSEGIMPVNLVKAYLERFNKPPLGTDLTYSNGHLVFRNEPWVVDLEFVTQLAGYSLTHFKRYKTLITRILASNNCKKIICWTEAGKRTVVESIDNQLVINKIELVHLAAPKKDFVKEYNQKEIKLLFVTSANIKGEFDIYGGKEVLAAYVDLKEKYSNVTLTIRSDVPVDVKNRYQGLKDLRIIEEIIPWSSLELEFKHADIFIFPAHSTPGMVILDAMSYELPVITTDVWANSEMVNNGKTGYVISKSDTVRYYTENFIPIWKYQTNSNFMKSIRNVDSKVVDEIVEKTSFLIENPDIRKKMGKAGRQEIENGKFSIENRNTKLKRIFDEGIGAMNPSAAI